MKQILLIILALSSLSFAQTLTCRETCQYWDDFERTCNYATRCEVGTTLLRYSYCDRYDSFARKCVYELTQVTPYNINPFGALPSCTERCQYFDNFTGQCLYKTTCTYSSNILKYTECERWDDFERRCLYSRNSVYWNVY